MNFAKKTLVCAFLLTAGALAAAAQDRTVNFTLTQDAYFSSTLLSPGHYRLQLITEATPKVIVSSLGEKTKSAIAAVTVREYGACKRTSITLSPSQDKMAMTSICLADMDLTYYFPTTQTPRATQVAQTQSFVGGH